MIIDDLIRIGRIFLGSGLPPDDTLLLVSDAGSPRAAGFFHNVFVVEVTGPDGDDAICALPRQTWGGESLPHPKAKKPVFHLDARRALGAPFVSPRGGNPTFPYGTYGTPAFPVFSSTFSQFQQSPESIDRFLEARLSRCRSLTLSEQQRASVARRLFERINQDASSRPGKALALLVLCDVAFSDSPYQLVDSPSGQTLGPSIASTGKYLAPRHDRILELFWLARIAEAAEHGRRHGTCSICGRDDSLTSSYCKAWPWYLPSWNCPLADGGNKKLLVESLALCSDCYRSLCCGAAYFDKLSRPICAEVTRELFSPVPQAPGPPPGASRPLAALPTIYGAGLLLPILDDAPQDAHALTELAANLASRLQPESSSRRLQQHLDDVAGFEMALPDGLSDDDYRVVLFYFSGQPSRGDVHLRSVIQDALPSVLRQLREIGDRRAERSLDLLPVALPGISENYRSYLLARIRSVPYLLTRAYGGAYLWDQLQRVLRRAPLGLARPSAHAAHRMSTLVPRWPRTAHQLRQEVFFYLTFLDFVRDYDDRLRKAGTTTMPMRPWKELLQAVFETPVDAMQFDGPGELGFACGALLRRFARQYWIATKVGNDGRDYLRHRVLALGSGLSPELVSKKALPGIFDVEARVQRLHLKDDFRRRVGVVLNLLQQSDDEVRRQRDNFMTGFWSGYVLQGPEARANQYSNSRTANQTEEAVTHD